MQAGNLICALLILAIIYPDGAISGASEYSLMTNPTGFNWMTLDPSILGRLPPPPDLSSGADFAKRMDLELRIVPDGYDPRIFDSRFIIVIDDSISSYRIYDGPFRQDIALYGVPVRYPSVFATFWVFNEASGTYLQWSSLNPAPMFARKRAQVDLYHEYNEDADSWYRVTPRAE